MSPTVRCAFLSTDDLEGFVVDDDTAYAAMRARGVDVVRVSWRDVHAHWSDYDVVVVRSPWDYQQDSLAFFEVLESIDASEAVLANPLPAMRWNLHKTYLRELHKQGVNIVPTRFGESLDARQFADLARDFGGREWVLKPVIGANADGVFRLPARADDGMRDAALAYFAARAWMAQPFMGSVTATGEYSLFYFDGAFSHSILKTPRRGDFRVQEEHGGKISAVPATPALRDAGAAVCACLPAGCLYVRVDLVRDAAGHFAVIEVELIEPSMYLRMDELAPARFADALLAWLARARGAPT